MEKVQLNSINKKHNGREQSENEKSSTIPRPFNVKISTTEKISEMEFQIPFRCGDAEDVEFQIPHLSSNLLSYPEDRGF